MTHETGTTRPQCRLFARSGKAGGTMVTLVTRVKAMHVQGGTMHERVGKQYRTERPLADTGKHAPRTAQILAQQQRACIHDGLVVSDQQDFAGAGQLTGAQAQQHRFIVMRTRQTLRQHPDAQLAAAGFDACGEGCAIAKPAAKRMIGCEQRRQPVGAHDLRGSMDMAVQHDKAKRNCEHVHQRTNGPQALRRKARNTRTRSLKETAALPGKHATSRANNHAATRRPEGTRS